MAPFWHLRTPYNKKFDVFTAVKMQSFFYFLFLAPFVNEVPKFVQLHLSRDFTP